MMNPWPLFRTCPVLLLVAVVAITHGVADASPAADGGIGPSQLFSRNASSLVTEITSLSQILDNLVRDRFSANVVAFYDSADLNSWRHKGAIEGAATMLDGFARVWAADIRNPAVAMLASAWTVNTVPWIYGVGPKQHKPRAEEFAGAPNVAALGGGMRVPIPRVHNFGLMSPTEIRKFGLTLVAESEHLITRVETDAQLKTIAAKISTQTAADNNNNNNRPLVALFTDKDASSLLYRAVAARFASGADFYEINIKKATKYKESFSNVKKAPTLLVFSPAAAKPEDGDVYSGALAVQELAQFISKFVPQSRLDELDRAAKAANGAALQREIRRRQSPLLHVRDEEAWATEVQERAGVVGLFFLPGRGNDDAVFAAARDKAETAVREARAKEAGKNIRSNVVQFVSLPLGDAKFQKLAEMVMMRETPLDAEELNKTHVYFISGRKGVVTKHIGSLSGDGLFDFMRSDLVRGKGVKNINVAALKKAFAS